MRSAKTPPHTTRPSLASRTKNTASGFWTRSPGEVRPLPLYSLCGLMLIVPFETTGAIELSVFAKHYRCEIAAMDVARVRYDVYGTGRVLSFMLSNVI